MPKDTELHKAAYKADVGELEDLIKSGVDVNILGAGKRTALHRACGENNIECVKFLISVGAKVDLADGSGRYPMYFPGFLELIDRHWAAVGGAVETAQVLSEKGADLNAVTKAGQTCLHMCAENGKVPMIEWLLAQGVDQTIVDKKNRTALMIAKEKKRKEVLVLLSPPSAGCCLVQ